MRDGVVGARGGAARAMTTVPPVRARSAAIGSDGMITNTQAVSGISDRIMRLEYAGWIYVSTRQQLRARSLVTRARRTGCQLRARDARLASPDGRPDAQYVRFRSAVRACAGCASTRARGDARRMSEEQTGYARARRIGYARMRAYARALARARARNMRHDKWSRYQTGMYADSDCAARG